MGPVRSFRWFARVVGRRPRLVAAIGLGLVAEGGRVVWTTARGGPVALLGRSGIDAFDPEADRSLLLLYVAWVTLCGMLLLAMARRASRDRSLGRGAVGGRLRSDAPSGPTRR